MSKQVIPQCIICLEQFSCKREMSTPRILPCGHSYCTQCLGDLMQKSSLVICPTCRQVHVPSTNKGAENFVKNYVLMDMMAMIEPATQQQNHTSESNIQENNSDDSNNSNNNSSQKQQKSQSNATLLQSASSASLLASPRGPLESPPPSPSTSRNIPGQGVWQEQSQGQGAGSIGIQQNHISLQDKQQYSLPTSDKNLSTSDTHLMTAIRNVPEGDTLDLKEMMVIGEGPLYIDNRVTIKNANFCVRGGVVVIADGVKLEDVTISIFSSSTVDNSMVRGNLLHVRGKDCKVRNCRLEVQMSPFSGKYTGVFVPKGSLTLDQTTIAGCNNGIRADHTSVKVTRCNITVDSYAIYGRGANMNIEACNVQSYRDDCINITTNTTCAAKECSFLAMGDSVAQVFGANTSLQMDQCRMQAGRVAAIKVEEFAQLKMEHCEIGGCQEDAMKLRDGDTSKFSVLKGAGILARGGSQAHLLNCSMVRIPYGIVGVNGGTRIKVECCNLLTMLTHIFVEHGAHLVAHHCNLVDAMGNGAVVAGYQGSQIEMERCKVQQGYCHLLHAMSGGRITAMQCDIWGTQQTAVCAWSKESMIQIMQSRLGGSAQAVVLTQHHAQVIIKQSEVWGLKNYHSRPQTPGLHIWQCTLK